MVEIVRCKRCNHILHSLESIKKGYGRVCMRIIKLQKAEQQMKLDMKEIKDFITSEIQNILKKFNFSRPIINNNIENGILPIKITKMPKFNPVEANKRLVVKELKTQLAKGINNVLQKVGSFDDKINFYETPIGVLA
ncbi:hypothetical protein LCGC14_1594830 [marine sediment metagenome]|uniref:Uncharacterized protein n=1 Tax=marine sediment metagenome TaxID=412755 RepID=A0A0F9IZ87_9ZZZZ